MKKTKMNYKMRITLFGLFVILFYGCYPIKIENIKYNEKKELYEYSERKNYSILLRNDSGKLISDKNYIQFKDELAKNKFRYKFGDKLENSSYLKQSDLLLTELYSDVARKIKEADYKLALNNIERLRKIYLDIDKYSDCLFLEAYCYEKLNILDSANINYSKFLDYSSNKYSSRFRGYKYFDKNDSIWQIQREYSKQYLLGQKPSIKPIVLTELLPKYFNTSFHPGYLLNQELLSPKELGYIWIWAGYSFSEDFVFGLQTYHKINKYLDINPSVFYSRNIKGLNLALPIKIYNSEDNRFGLKFSPFLNYSRFDSLTIDKIKYKVDEGALNIGAKFSFGYYFTQKLSFGAYYSYNLYNKDNYKTLSKSNINVWWNNMYDISLYYNIYEAFSLKTGIKDDGFVAGLFWSGWEVSYDITNSKLIFLIDLY